MNLRGKPASGGRRRGIDGSDLHYISTIHRTFNLDKESLELLVTWNSMYAPTPSSARSLLLAPGSGDPDAMDLDPGSVANEQDEGGGVGPADIFEGQLFFYPGTNETFEIYSVQDEVVRARPQDADSSLAEIEVPLDEARDLLREGVAWAQVIFP